MDPPLIAALAGLASAILIGSAALVTAWRTRRDQIVEQQGLVVENRGRLSDARADTRARADASLRLEERVQALEGEVGRLWSRAARMEHDRRG